jgi:maleate isomerase
MAGFIGEAKARLGVILSSGNWMLEPQFRRFAPPDMALHVTRMRMSGRWITSLDDLKLGTLRAGELLADAKVDQIVLQATGVAMDRGPAVEAEVIDGITKTTGIPAFSAAQAMVEALHALNLKRLVVVTPFDTDTNAREKAYLEALGFQVLREAEFAPRPGEESLTLPPQRWLEIVQANARPDADGYFLSGSNTTMMEAVPLVEAALGKPAVNSIQATLWASVKRLKAKLGPATFPKELGRLFGATMR